MIFRSVFVVLLLCVFVRPVLSQQLRPLPSTRILGELHKLKKLTSVLYIAAHPDDENTRLLAWLAMGQNIRTGYLSLTRGDGGQNILGSEQGAALGLIRTHELLAAREIDGAEQFFTRALDFGFSKNPNETFRHWDSAVLIADVVRVMREMRPDVVICRFPKDSMAGHGQHSASAIIAEEAVRYCYGISTLRKDQIDYIDSILLAVPSITGSAPWKPTRLLFNAFRFGNRSTIKQGMFNLEVGQYDPRFGLGYGEIAGLSRSLHKSQGAGTPSTPGVQSEYFDVIAGSAPYRTLFDGIDTTWSRVGEPKIGDMIDSIITSFDIYAPEKSLDRLLDLRAQIAQVRDPFWNQQKIKEIDLIIRSCIGLTADVSVPIAALTPGDTARATLRLVTRARRPVPVRVLSMPGGGIARDFVSEHDSLYSDNVRITVPYSTSYTNPYWLDKDPKQAMFKLSDEQLAGLSVTPSQLDVSVILTLGNENLLVTLPLSYKKLDPLRGDVIQQLRVVPPVSIEPLQDVVFCTNKTALCKVRVRSYTSVLSSSFQLRHNDSLVYVKDGIVLRPQTDTVLEVPLQTAKNLNLTAVLQIGSSVYDKTVTTITYDHLPDLQYLKNAIINVVAEKIHVRADRVGFIQGAGERTIEILRGLGVTVDELHKEEVQKPEELGRYSTIVMGVRALNTQPWLQFAMPTLLRYVENGGRLIVQYNTLQDLVTAAFAPYPLTISRSRVTEEDAVVQMLDTLHPLMQSPNRISSQDFQGWVQERSVYNPSPYDKAFTELLLMNDSGEEPQRGTLLYTTYGKGDYVYTSLSLFRQLPSAVVGGLKLIANLISR